MLFGIIIGTIGGYIYYRTKEPDTARNILPLLLITIGFGTIGFIDDFKKLVLRDTKGLKPAYKMLGLLIISVAYTLYLTKGIHLGTETFIPFAKKYIVLPILLYIPFVIFVMLGTTNAINLTDGIDGLSTSISAIITTCLTVIAIVLDVKEIIVFGSIIESLWVILGSLLLRWSNFSDCIILKNAVNITNNCINTSSRNNFRCITSCLF